MSNQLSNISHVQAVGVVDGATRVNDDFNFARENLLEIITNGNEAIATIMQLADQSQSPRFYEVLAKLMATVSDANEKLLEIQKRIRDINKSETNKTQTIQNTLIITTDELQKMLKEKHGT